MWQVAWVLLLKLADAFRLLTGEVKPESPSPHVTRSVRGRRGYPVQLCAVRCCDPYILPPPWMGPTDSPRPSLLIFVSSSTQGEPLEVHADHSADPTCHVRVRPQQYGGGEAELGWVFKYDAKTRYTHMGARWPIAAPVSYRRMCTCGVFRLRIARRPRAYSGNPIPNLTRAPCGQA